MKLSDQFVDPCSYGQLSLTSVPGTVISMLTPECPQCALPPEALKTMSRSYDKVVLFLVDGFGWREFTSGTHGSRFIETLAKHGALLKLGTQFPSTTACNVTTVNTGLSVAQHGLYEWFYYEPEADDVIAPLLYSHAREQKVRDTLKRDKNLRPAAIYPSQNLYQKLNRYGVRSFAFQSKDYARSTFSDIIFCPATVSGYGAIAEGLAAVAKAVIDEPGKAYYYFYYDGLDSALHRHGPGSQQARSVAREFLSALESAFWEPVSSGASDTLFILTADHGQTAIDPARTIYLNLELPEISRYLCRNRKGKILAPAGSCRDMFLYVKDEFTDTVIALLQDLLKGKAVVCRTADLIRQGYFGSCDISEALRRRLGNLVILPLPGESVWWYEKGVFEVDFKGHHGGLTRDEMEIPFLAWCSQFRHIS